MEINPNRTPVEGQPTLTPLSTRPVPDTRPEPPNPFQQLPNGPLDARFDPSGERAGPSLVGVLMEALASNGGARPEEFAELTPEQQQEEAFLIRRHRDVTDHEEAHENRASAGGVLAGSASYSYSSGASGRQYRVSGFVMIDMEETGNAQEDARRAQAIVEAAEAPSTLGSSGAAELSSSDRTVAARGRSMLAKALSEIGDRE